MKEKPLVSVHTLVYNHEEFLGDYFRGILMQKTDFPFEVIIHDDCSTDGSAAIIRKYAKAYPGLIRPIFEEENQYSKGISIFSRIVYPLCRGKYIAHCEGDDCWHDPLKLQKQVDFLETHPEYGFVYTDYHQIDESGAVMANQSRHDGLKKRFRSGDLLADFFVGNFPQTCTVLYRAELFDPKFFEQGGYDYTLFSFLSGKTKFYYMDEDTACYRIQPRGASMSGELAGPRYRALTVRTVQMCADCYLSGYFPKRKGWGHWKILCAMISALLGEILRGESRREALRLMTRKPEQWLLIPAVFTYKALRKMYRKAQGVFCGEIS